MTSSRSSRGEGICEIVVWVDQVLGQGTRWVLLARIEERISYSIEIIEDIIFVKYP